MRVLRVILFVVAIIVTGLWIAAYIYVGALGCAFVTNSSGCRIEMPWELRGEDLVIFVLIPCAIVAALWALAFFTGRRREE